MQFKKWLGACAGIPWWKYRNMSPAEQDKLREEWQRNTVIMVRKMTDDEQLEAEKKCAAEKERAEVSQKLLGADKVSYYALHYRWEEPNGRLS